MQVNGKLVGFNRGGYSSFTIDVTETVLAGTHNELLVFVHDPTDSGDHVIPIGKQTLRKYLECYPGVIDKRRTL